MRTNLLTRIVSWVDGIGRDPQDSEEVRLQKSLLVRISLMIVPAAVLWSAIYYAFGERLPAAIPFSYSVISLLSIAYYGRTHRYEFFRFSQLLLIVLLPFLLMMALGGFVNSSAVIVWSFLSPLGALVFAEPRQAPRWFLAYLGLVLLSTVLQPYVRLDNNLPRGMRLAFFGMNIGAISIIAFSVLFSFVNEKNRAYRLLRVEQEKSEGLLLNILPREIAAILKNEKRTIAEHFDCASVLFADLVDFTPLTAQLPPAEMVGLLNEVFSHFDSLVEKYDVEKIRTIGDNYMVASGVPRRRPDHAHALAHLALDMRDYLRQRPPHAGRKLEFRIGINSGPLIGGVIGRRKFVYDLWGDPVNLASRMESQGVPGKIQIARQTYELIKDEFHCEPRGTIPVKGKTEMETWYLEGRKT